MVNISAALKIRGWTEEAELAWLAEQAAEHRVIIEVGAFLGRSTRALGDNTSGIVFALDSFQGLWDDLPEDTFSLFAKNLAGLIPRKVIPVFCEHDNPPDLPAPDMVFIDGDHPYESVIRDIRYWQKRVSPGGLLCGHDFSWPDVHRAVLELIPNVATVPGTDIWLIP